MIKFSKSEISLNDIFGVSKILKSGWLTHGKYTIDFEKEFKKYTGSKYSISVSSCTAGLHLSCLALGFAKGDEVIVPAQTHTATAHAVEYTGARVIFADVEKFTGNMMLANIKKKITKKTKGIIVVHMAGNPCTDIINIRNYCKKKKIILLEDCAHSVGSVFRNKHLGNFGKTGSFSFYPTKQITTGEGGIVITNDKKIFNKIKTLKAFGIDKDINDRKKQGTYDVKSLGFNYRSTEFQTYLGLQQLKRYKKNLLIRKKLAKKYFENFKHNKNINTMPYNKNSSFFIFQIFLKSRKKRDEILLKLKKKNIGVSIHYATPLNKMTYYKKKYKLKNQNFPCSVEYGDTNISLPVYPKLKMKEVDTICNFINKETI